MLFLFHGRTKIKGLCKQAGCVCDKEGGALRLFQFFAFPGSSVLRQYKACNCLLLVS